MGIAAEDVPKLFQRFFRVDSSLTREIGGTGLGLSIVKSIVEMHGGRSRWTARPARARPSASPSRAPKRCPSGWPEPLPDAVRRVLARQADAVRRPAAHVLVVDDDAAVASMWRSS